MSSIADKVPNSDDDSHCINGDEANSVHGGGESSNHVISGAQISGTMSRNFTHDFPQAFRTVPTMSGAYSRRIRTTMETATKMFADLRRRVQLNMHHMDVLCES
jgi:hypothetical protein